MNAGNFHKVIECLKSHAVTGLHFKLNGRDVSIVAEHGTSHTTVVLPPQRNHVGYGVFFVPFDDLYNCKNALKHDPDEPVVLTRSTQPLVPDWASLHIEISDWFSAHVGHLRKKGVPKIRKSGGTLGDATIKSVAHSLRSLSKGSTYTHSVSKGTVRVALEEPDFGLLAVYKEVS